MRPGARAVKTIFALLALSLAVGGWPGRLEAALVADVEADEHVTAPVVLDGATLLRVRGVSALPAHERAERIASRIAAAASDPSFDPGTLRVAEGQAGTEIHAGARRLMVVTETDTAGERASRAALAAVYGEAIREAIGRFRADRSAGTLGRALFGTVVIALALAAVLAVVLRLGRRLEATIDERLRRRIRPVQIESYKLIDAERIRGAVRSALRTTRLILSLTASFVALALALRRFPWTRGAANNLLSYLVDPLRAMVRATAEALPSLVFLVVLAVIVRWVLKAARLFFDSVKRGNVTLRGFDPEWGMPTYRLVRIVVVAFAAVVAYPYIPGSNSEAFKAISIFAGVLLSLGSSSIIASIIAGYAMTYRRTFHVGDRVKIGDVMGDVEQIGVMVTRLRTIKNEEAVIPNSVILQDEVLNYSTYAQREGLIVHTRVGIGYEVPWRQVEGILLLAADRTPGIRREPRPFVRQTELADFCVNYELNVYCDDPHAMQELYTALHRNVLDAFNEHGVQIMTPSYEGDPAQPKLVPRDQWYAPPARIDGANPEALAGTALPPAAAAK